jgi:hypothetical protein
MVVQVVIDPGPGVGNSQHAEQGGLLDLFIRVKTGFKAREKGLPQGGEKLGVVGGWIKNHGSVGNKLSLYFGIVHEIRFHPQGQNLRYPFEPAPQGHKLVSLFSHSKHPEINSVRTL